MGTAEIIGHVLAIAATLAVLSFLYGDNPFYKFAEHLFLGVSAGYILVLEMTTTVIPDLLQPLLTLRGFPGIAWWLLLVPLALSLLMFAGLSERYSWLASLTITFIVGMYAGKNIIGFASGDLILQLRATMLPVVARDAAGEVALGTSINNVLIIVGVVSSLSYFFFSRPHTGALGVTSRVGVWFLMVSFGASFGFTVMGRISLAVGRAQELLDWPWTTFVLAVLMIGVLAYLARRGRDQRSEGPVSGSAQG